MCSGGSRKTPWSLNSPQRQGTVEREKQGAQGGVSHQTPPSVVVAFIITFSWIKLLRRRDCPSHRSPPALPVTPWDRPGRAGKLLPIPFHFSSNFCPQGSSKHASESLPAFATSLTQSGTPAPPLLLRWQGEPTTAGFTGKHCFIFLIISDGCGSALTAGNYSLPSILRSQIAH